MKKREAGLMRLADACALLQSGDLDILHILRYKYPPDVYYSHKTSGAKTLGRWSIFRLLN